MALTNAQKQSNYRSRLRQKQIQEIINKIEKLKRQLRRLYKTEGKNHG